MDPVKVFQDSSADSRSHVELGPLPHLYHYKSISAQTYGVTFGCILPVYANICIHIITSYINNTCMPIELYI